MDGESLVAGSADEDKTGYVEFWQAGAAAKGEFHCSECGYGVIISKELPSCPMCGGGSWEQAPWAPFGRSRALR